MTLIQDYFKLYSVLGISGARPQKREIEGYIVPIGSSNSASFNLGTYSRIDVHVNAYTSD